MNGSIIHHHDNHSDKANAGIKVNKKHSQNQQHRCNRKQRRQRHRLVSDQLQQRLFQCIEEGFYHKSVPPPLFLRIFRLAPPVFTAGAAKDASFS